MSMSRDNLNDLLDDLLGDDESPDCGSPLVDLPGYEIGAFVAEGGSSIVFKAVQSSTGQIVAIKFFKRHAVDRAAFERFKREVASLVSLDHRAFPRVIDCGEYDGSRFIVQEFIEGKHLLDLVDQQGLKEKDLVRLMVRIARAVEAAHSVGIIHRDLKPENILVNEKSEIVIIDFGIATGETGRHGFTQDLTVEGAAVGTVGYMSPEQARGECELTAASDVFSLGVITVKLLTGVMPHDESGSTHERIVRIGKEPAVVGALEGIERPDVLRRILLKALELDVGRRYVNAGALANDLDGYLEGGGVSFGVEGTGIHVRKGRWWFGVGIPVVLCVVVLVVFGLRGMFGEEDDLADADPFAGFNFGDEEQESYFSDGLLDDAVPLVGSGEGEGPFGLPGIEPEEWKGSDEMLSIKELVTAGVLTLGVVTSSMGQCEIEKLIGEGMAGYKFGFSVATDGDVAVVTCPKYKRAYIYRFDGINTWVMEDILSPSDGGGGSFGYDVDISQDAVILGAYTDDTYGDGAGAAYLYHYDGVSWGDEINSLPQMEPRMIILVSQFLSVDP